MYNSNCEGLHSDMLLCVCVCGQMACVCYLCWWGWRKPRGSMRIKLLLQLPCWHTHAHTHTNARGSSVRFCLYLGKLFMLIIYTELGACFTVMCVCIWFGCEVACHCVCMHAWHSTLLCVYVWQAEDDVGRAPKQYYKQLPILSLYDVSYKDSVLIWRHGGGHVLLWRGRSPSAMSPNQNKYSTYAHEHTGLKERDGFMQPWFQRSWNAQTFTRLKNVQKQYI